MTKKPLDLTKPVRTLDGRPARIICTDASTPGVATKPYPVVALVVNGLFENIYSYTREGRFADAPQHGANLVNVPEPTTVWTNVYPSGGRYKLMGSYDTEAQAKSMASERAIAQVPVTFEV